MRKCPRQNHSRSKRQKVSFMLEERQERWFNRSRGGKSREGDWGRGGLDLASIYKMTVIVYSVIRRQDIRYDH